MPWSSAWAAPALSARAPTVQAAPASRRVNHAFMTGCFSLRVQGGGPDRTEGVRGGPGTGAQGTPCRPPPEAAGWAPGVRRGAVSRERSRAGAAAPACARNERARGGRATPSAPPDQPPRPAAKTTSPGRRRPPSRPGRPRSPHRHPRRRARRGARPRPRRERRPRRGRRPVRRPAAHRSRRTGAAEQDVAWRAGAGALADGRPRPPRRRGRRSSVDAVDVGTPRPAGDDRQPGTTPGRRPTGSPTAPRDTHGDLTRAASPRPRSTGRHVHGRRPRPAAAHGRQARATDAAARPRRSRRPGPSSSTVDTSTDTGFATATAVADAHGRQRGGLRRRDRTVVDARDGPVDLLDTLLLRGRFRDLLLRRCLRSPAAACAALPRCDRRLRPTRSTVRTGTGRTTGRTTSDAPTPAATLSPTTCDDENECDDDLRRRDDDERVGRRPRRVRGVRGADRSPSSPCSDTWSNVPLNPLSADAEPADTASAAAPAASDQTRPQRPTAHPSTSGVSGLFPAPPPLAPEA